MHVMYTRFVDQLFRDGAVKSLFLPVARTVQKAERKWTSINPGRLVPFALSETFGLVSEP